jgi:outer membrane protein assembly factor BamB
MSRSDAGPTGTTRRQLLGTVAGAAVLGTAGCVSQIQLGDDDGYQVDDARSEEGRASYPEDVNIFQANLRRQGYYPDERVPDSVAVHWEFPHNFVGHTAAKSSPVPTLDRERVLFAGDSGRVEARKPTGETRWSTMTDATDLGFHGSPTVVGDVAYIGGYDGAIYALDVETGEIIWKTSAADLGGTLAVGSSPAYHDGVLYFIVEYGNPSSGALWAIDPATGQPLWHDDRLWGQPHPSPTIDLDAGRIFAGSNDGRVYCWEYPSLEFAWTYQAGPEGGPTGKSKAGGQFNLGAEIKGTVAAYDGRGYVGSWDNHLHCIDLKTGEGIWTFDTGRSNMSNPAIDPETGVVYTGSDSGFVFALDAETGEKRWEFDVGGRVIGAVTLTAETVLAGSYDTHVYALDAETGDQRWRVENRSWVTSAPVPVDGRIYYAERAVYSDYYDDEKRSFEQPGHAYCLVTAE